MRKQKMTSVEFMNWQGYGTKGRMHDIERIEKLLKREKYKPLATILDHNIRPNFYCFLMYYDKIKPARYRNTHKNILIKGKPYKFIYINDLINTTKIHYATGQYKKMSNSKGRWSTKLNVLALLGLIEKIQVEQIPPGERPFNVKASVDLQKHIKQHLPEHTKKYTKAVCYYYVPKFTLKIFEEANETAKIMIANHFTQGKFDRFWVDNAFGTDKANKIFTEHTGRTQQLNERETLVENAIIEAVNRLECCTRGDIINNVPLDQLKIYSFKPWEINETQYKKRVAEQIFRDIIEAVKLKYGLEYKRLNAEEKKKYNKTDSKWYVFRKE